VVAAVAGGEEERAEGEKKKSVLKSWSGFAHVTLLLPIIRICERCRRWDGNGRSGGGGFVGGCDDGE
jgi:hypothetical protein